MDRHASLISNRPNLLRQHRCDELLWPGSDGHGSIRTRQGRAAAGSHANAIAEPSPTFAPDRTAASASNRAEPHAAVTTPTGARTHDRDPPVPQRSGLPKPGTLRSQ